MLTCSTAENLDATLIDTKLKAKTCNSRVLQNSVIHDPIAFGSKDQKDTERVPQENELTLSLVKIYQVSPAAICHKLHFNN